MRRNSSLHNTRSYYLGSNRSSNSSRVSRPDTEKMSTRSKRKSSHRGSPPSPAASARNVTLSSLVTSKLFRLNCKQTVSNTWCHTFSFCSVATLIMRMKCCFRTCCIIAGSNLHNSHSYNEIRRGYAKHNKYFTYMNIPYN